MSWRTIQLGQGLCDQDRIILDLFKDKTVRYVGSDNEFKMHLNLSDNASNLVLILNQLQWCSNIIKVCQQYLTNDVNDFYIGINRYTILGNDTLRKIETIGQNGIDIVNFLSSVVAEQGFQVTKSGTFDNDLGRYFNFVQPLTWVYGTNVTNKSN